MQNKLRLFFVSFITIITFFVLYFILKLYPDILWFESFKYSNVWYLVFKSKFIVFSLFTLFTYLFLSINFKIAKKVSRQKINVINEPLQFPFSFLNEFFQQLRESSTNQPSIPEKLVFLITSIAALVISVLVGIIAKSNWELIYTFINQVADSLRDPIFSKDISFYFFSVPFFKFINILINLLLIAALAGTAWIYATNKLVMLVFAKGQENKGVKKHLLILTGLFFISLAFGVWLKIFGLTYSEVGAVFGAGYSDIWARWLGFKIIFLLYLIEAVLLFFFAFRDTIKIPVYFLGVIIVANILFLRIYPGIIQNYIVAPNELQKEKPFISNNIQFTRKGYQLDKVQEEEFPVENNLTQKDIENNPNTINNIRLWNQSPLKQTFSQLQEIRLYYEFLNIDVDRYMIAGEKQQVMLSPRELDPSQLTQQAQTWINRHLVYTHGYGVCMSPVSKVSKEGLPIFYIKDLPPVSDISLQVTQPEIYFGEKTANYVIVNTKQEEFDYPRGDRNQYTNYKGSGGILLDSIAKRIVYALKFSDIKILISSQITNESRLLYSRDIRSITKKIAPFLVYDSDPYLVISKNGRLVWMLDAYTISNRFPYSEPFNNSINYIRNAVKVTIDAYSGEINFYIADKSDVIIKTYAKIFKNLFKDIENMPADLRDHIRYPKDMFSVQSQIYATYHMTDPQVFYNREDLWALPKETYEENEQVLDPYYIVTRLPNDKKESFILMLPFTPTNKNNMISWLSADSDPENYGKLRVYKFPKEKTIYGPMQIESRIDQDTEISQKLTLWGQVGSRVIRGNIMVIPIEKSLIYVEPIYLQATQSKLPELKRVIFAYANKIVMKENLNQAISQIFGAKEESLTGDKSFFTLTSDKNVELSGNIVDTLKVEFQKFKDSAKNLDWKTFGEKLQSIDFLIQKLKPEPDLKK